MMNVALRMRGIKPHLMNFVLKTMKFASKMMDFSFKMRGTNAHHADGS